MKVKCNKSENIINHIFNDYDEFKEHVTNTKEEFNGVTVDFLNKYYNGNIMQWYKDNFSNKCCFNCKNCKECVNCYNCMNIDYTTKCSNVSSIEELLNLN